MVAALLLVLAAPLLMVVSLNRVIEFSIFRQRTFLVMNRRELNDDNNLQVQWIPFCFTSHPFSIICLSICIAALCLEVLSRASACSLPVGKKKVK